MDVVFPLPADPTGQNTVRKFSGFPHNLDVRLLETGHNGFLSCLFIHKRTLRHPATEVTIQPLFVRWSLYTSLSASNTTRLPVTRGKLSRYSDSVGLDVRGLNPGGREAFRTRTDRPWGPSSLVYNEYQVSFSRIKWLGRGIDNSPHLARRLKKEKSYTSTPLLGLYGLF